MSNAGGVFIALEGQDGSGKTTQLNLLKERLEREGFNNIRTISLPQDGQPSAYFVESYLKGDYGDPVKFNWYAASLFYVIDRYDANFKISRWLAEGNVVIADRWTLSNAAYQAAKIYLNTDDWLPVAKFLKWLNDLEHEMLNIARPFYVVFSVSSAASADLKLRQREAEGRELDGHEVDQSYQRAVASMYRYLADRNSYFYSKIATIQCHCEPDGERLLNERTIHQRVWEVVKGWLY